MKRIATRLAERVNETRRREIVLVFSLGFLLLFTPPVLLILLTDGYAKWIDDLIMIIGAIVFTIVPVWVAGSRVPWYSGGERERRTENRGWYLIAVAGGFTLVARCVYAWLEGIRGGTDVMVPLADLFTGISLVFLLIGLLHLPWTRNHRRGGSALINAMIVVTATGTFFWPILIGPALDGALGEAVGLASITNYLGIVFILAVTMLWIVMSDLREELWPTALAFLIAVGCMILVQVGVLTLLVTEDSTTKQEIGQLMISAGVAASYLLIGLAGLLRVGSMNSEPVRITEIELAQTSGIVPLWQMMMPYPIIMALLAVRIAMEMFDWQMEYRAGMVYGLALIVVLFMIWQVPMLRANQDIYRRLAQSSIRDGLTGLYSHRALHDLLHDEVHRARRSGQPVSVLFMDIDRFKQFNDTYGHKAGDEVLERVAEMLRSSVRAGDIVGRYGGEEFMVIAPGAPAHFAVQLGDRIREALVAGQFEVDGDHPELTLSVGVSNLPVNSYDAEELIDLADRAMYRAKQTGRNRTVVWSGAEDS